MTRKLAVLPAVLAVALAGCSASAAPVKRFTQPEAEGVYRLAFIAKAHATSSVKTHCEGDTRSSDYREGEWSCEGVGWKGEHDCIAYHGIIDPEGTNGFDKVAYVKVETTGLGINEYGASHETGTELPAKVCESVDKALKATAAVPMPTPHRVASRASSRILCQRLDEQGEAEAARQKGCPPGRMGRSQQELPPRLSSSTPPGQWGVQTQAENEEAGCKYGFTGDGEEPTCNTQAEGARLQGDFQRERENPQREEGNSRAAAEARSHEECVVRLGVGAC